MVLLMLVSTKCHVRLPWTEYECVCPLGSCMPISYFRDSLISDTPRVKEWSCKGIYVRKRQQHKVCLLVQSICIMSLLTRSSKHLYKVYMQGVDMMNLAAAISHFLNCYLGSFSSPHTQVAVDETVLNCWLYDRSVFVDLRIMIQ